MKLGIIGGGAVGKKHAEAARKAGLEIGWVVDPNPQAGTALADQFDASYADQPEPLWEDASVKAVVIAVPNSLHLPLSLAAMQSGKDVLLEKPMALNLHECEQIGRCVESTGRILQIGFVHRYTEVGKCAKQLSVTGQLGDIYHAQAFLFLQRNIPGLGKWFTNRELSGGGALIDVGVHLIDLAMHVLGFPQVETVVGQTFSNFGVRMADYHYEEMWSGPPDLSGKCDVEDAAQAFIRFENGAVLDLHVAWAGNYSHGKLPSSLMSFSGTQGAVSFELFGADCSHLIEQNGTLVEKAIPLEGNDFFYEQIVDFSHSVQSRTVSQADYKQGCAVHAIVDAIYESSRKRRSPQPVGSQNSIPV